MRVASVSLKAAFIAVLHLNYVAAAGDSSLYTALLDVADSLGETQPQSDISPVVELAKKNKDKLDQVSAHGETDAVTACDVFATLFPGKYADQSSGDYTAEVERPISGTCWLKSTCFFEAHTTSDVAFGLKIVTTLGTKFATRSGGHQQNVGFSSIEDGVVLDLSRLTSSSLSEDHKTVRLGTGNRWGEVYNRLEEYGLGAVGGRSGDVGVGGLILGVGIPFFSSKYGFACDNVQQFEVVLANSTVVNATANSHPDLFKALKGGGPNYGIVTHFTLYTIPTDIWYHVAQYNESDYKQVLSAIVATQAKMEDDSNAGVLFSGSNGTMMVGMLYAEPTENPPVFSAFDSLKPIRTLAPPTIGTIAKLVDFFTANSPTARYLSFATSYETDLDLYKSAYGSFISRQHFTSPTKGALQYGIQTITKAAVQAGQKRGGNWLGMKPVSTNWWHVVAAWFDEKDDKAALEASTGMMKNMTNLATDAGKYLDFQFQNDADVSQSPLKSYGEENFKKFAAVAASYDPQQVFQKLQNSGFKISKA
ncbi:hypothetical protein BDW42DRAFT_164384 [Aspergillus taichungensis]|uniref:FAD-binding PCMH-type domain-containing protein n=1 Tax=Aspergillus taichungensis TaxID=482145 RepID=A0A2J5I1I1_9EURO|nr:hypothetical protein BDW42DRAFT_164384 [Aspergillus taichungensis]